ncbi:hypothetical protein SMACR_05174 [Sordaria macrospora]|uniref:Mannosyltransferase n=2 Tax=Sordaria macrospora TaxID=5147 RepID=F7VV62_SORMK|nr:uncharacterized protein SMAC_05174 [Sordaria macrospora k-hell]KAA8632431.1 hypothetical protein SMACR_05174 [Sordaria macrospora]KAH7628801.1 Alg9-like mannosyltransferase family-domain-containing protein [Sordaria sp. MPI-SDFR-AT-0083]WPJ57293.1 hypothetical protein SMAC4_05174 [Sordaria macrospora]CCC09409.1 unnamed protein product [Sordaria macrospora k-hell]
MKIISVLDLGLSLLIPILILLHLFIAPYTKVEESFNIQATHDVLVYGTPLQNAYHKLSQAYDHFTFPGAVPRTFVGPVVLAGLGQPIVNLIGFDHAQSIVRGMLGLANAAALIFFARNFRRAYGRPAARWYLLLQASQFHVIFYASRTLPNMFAFGLTTTATALLLPSPQSPELIHRRHRSAISLLVMAGIIFRSEVALLLFTTIFHLLFVVPSTSLERIIPHFIVAVIVSLIMTVPLDSYFWQKPLWPELWGFYFNAVKGNSSEWGTSPCYYYFVSAIPRLLVNPLTWGLMIPVAWKQPAIRPAVKGLLVPSLLFVAIYSLQPHKEARFVFYVVPSLTGAAALGADWIARRSFKAGKTAAILTWGVLLGSIAVSFVASTGMLLVSSLNYPGGEALAYLRDTVQAEVAASSSSSAVVPVHADVLSCMTGVTLFGTATGYASAVPSKGKIVRKSPGSSVVLSLDKTEDDSVLAQEEFWKRFDYVLAEDTTKVKGDDWETVSVVNGYGGIEILLDGSAQCDKSKEDIPVVGKGVSVERWRNRVKAITGGKWVGPKMVPRIYILRRVKHVKRARETVDV